MVIFVQETVETANEANSEADEPNECRPKTNKNLGIDYFNNQESHLKKTGAMSKYFDFPSDVEAYPTVISMLLCISRFVLSYWWHCISLDSCKK